MASPQTLKQILKVLHLESVSSLYNLQMNSKLFLERRSKQCTSMAATPGDQFAPGNYSHPLFQSSMNEAGPSNYKPQLSGSVLSR